MSIYRLLKHNRVKVVGVSLPFCHIYSYRYLLSSEYIKLNGNHVSFH
nr:MAG TPA: hypothetical protein [Bacteriophage sp.]